MAMTQAVIISCLTFISMIEAYLCVGEIREWFLSKTPYLIHHHPIAPHITGCRIFVEVNRLHARKEKGRGLFLCSNYGSILIINHLRGSPFDWDLSSLGHVVGAFSKTTRHSKITDLQHTVTCSNK